MAFILSIKNLFVRVLSLLFGKTWIFITILGWFLILTGILLILRPERARRKLMRMTFRPVKWILLIVFDLINRITLKKGLGQLFECGVNKIHLSLSQASEKCILRSSINLFRLIKKSS